MRDSISDLYAPKVLLVENDEDDAIILSRLLLKTGLDVKTEWVGSIEALSHSLKLDEWDLVISDYFLQQGTAMNVAEAIKKHDAALPFIVVSHSIGEKAAVEIMKAGAKDVINKSEHQHLLASVSKELLEVTRAQERKKLKTQISSIDRKNQELEEALQSVKAAQNESRSLLTELNQIFNSSPDGMRVVDVDFNVTRINENYVLFSENQTFTGTNTKCYHMTPSKKCHTDQCVLTRILNGESRLEEQITQKDRTGKERHFVLSASALKTDDGEILGIVENLRDISDWQQMQQQYLHAQKMESIGQLAAGIAHEINTPTQFVGDNTTFLKEAFDDLLRLYTAYEALAQKATESNFEPQMLKEIDDAIEEADLEFLMEEIPKAISQSLEGIDRVSSIVKAMKEFSHPGTEEAQLFNVNQSIQNTLTVARNEWKYVSRLDLEFGFKLPLVRGYPGEFNQAILNMIINSAHAIEDAAKKKEDSSWKGVIGVSTSLEENNILIKIRDTGAGIPEDVKKRIFDPFFTTKGVGKGTGQGLAIAHSSIVDKHRGTITVESQLGKGTTFFIRLPVNFEEQKSAEANS